MKEIQYKLNREIGYRIRNQREFLGYTREELSEMADISSQFLADIEVGRKSMTALTIIKLSKSLSLSADFILFGEAGSNTIHTSSLADTEFEHNLTHTFRSMSDSERKGGLNVLLAYVKALNDIKN